MVSFELTSLSVWIHLQFGVTVILFIAQSLSYWPFSGNIDLEMLSPFSLRKGDELLFL